MERLLDNRNKWLEVAFKPKYVALREKVLQTFSDLEFYEDTHTYILKGKELASVSNVTHIFKPDFDTEAKAQEMVDKYFYKEGNKYYQMTVDEIKTAWKNKSEFACDKGTDVHAFGESCFYYMIGQYDKILPNFKDRLRSDGLFEARSHEESAVVDFFNDLPINIIPILSETRVYSEELGYAGTFDILFYFEHQTDEDKSGFYIMDFKTNEDLYKNFNKEKMLPPFDDLLNMPLSLYKLQLSLYRIPLIYIGFNVIAHRIIWARPHGVYEKKNLEDYSSMLIEALEGVVLH